MAVLGAHESVAGGLHRAFERIEKVGGESLQIFTRNQRQWNPAPLAEDETSLFKEAHRKSGNIPVASHASYLINLATDKPKLLEKSISGLVLEFERCHALGVPYVVMHPDSHGGAGVEAGLERFVKAMDRAFEISGLGVSLLLETTAGQGTGLGSRFEELSCIIEESRFADQLGVCVDTCHIFAAGYELRTADGYAATIQRLEETVGVDRVKFFHLNDSKKELGSRVDRHEHIGEGEIGLDGFRNLLADVRFKGLPMTLETPKSDSLIEDTQNLQTLRSLL